MLGKIEYLSPSGYKLYRNDKEEFYRQYLSGIKRTYGPQNKAMAVGSAFGARVQSSLAVDLLKIVSPIDKLLKDSVTITSPEREEVLRDSETLFSYYRSVGAYADLLAEISQGIVGTFNYEFKMTGHVSYMDESVTLHGRPDIFFNVDNLALVPDFKLNGIYSNSGASPVRYASKIRKMDGTWSPHRDFRFHKVGPITCHKGCLSEVDVEWAIQLTMYAWLCGVPVGGNYVLGIENIVGPLSAPRFATARFPSPSREWQERLFGQLVKAWEVINSDHYFREMTFEDSFRRCELLSQQVPSNDWLTAMIEKDKPKW